MAMWYRVQCSRAQHAGLHPRARRVRVTVTAAHEGCQTGLINCALLTCKGRFYWRRLSSPALCCPPSCLPSIPPRCPWAQPCACMHWPPALGVKKALKAASPTGTLDSGPLNGSGCLTVDHSIRLLGLPSTQKQGGKKYTTTTMRQRSHVAAAAGTSAL
jgi:hypothetical protein